MDSFEIQELFRYNQWANHLILESAEKAGPERFLAHSPSSFGSLRGTLVHIYGAEYIWRMRFDKGISPSSLPAENDFPDLVSLKTAWEQEMLAMEPYTKRLGGEIPNSIKYTNTRGVNFETSLWQIMLHLVNHGTQFRSEAGMLLSSWGFSPGDVDMIAFFRLP